MKIITWNCAGAFRNKTEEILQLSPDVLIIQECEELEKIDCSMWTAKPSSVFRYGRKDKGIGVFAFSDFKIEKFDWHNEKFEYVVPLNISRENLSLNVFATWTKRTFDDCYTRQIFDAMKYYDEFFPEILSKNSIIIGDFNSSSIWDKKNRDCNHSNLVEYLKFRKIESAYHKFFNEEQGKETYPTLYHQKKELQQYHIDYCFSSTSLLDKMSKIEVGKYEDFISKSDHMPLIVEFEI